VLTGARSFQLRSFEELEATLTTVAAELRQQYLLGYAPRPEADGAEPRWTSIQVRLTGGRPGLRVRARDGYWR
jgi:hypothetical protein